MILSAEFILSVSMIALIVLALFELKVHGPEVNIQWRSTLKENWQAYKLQRIWWVISIPFFLVLLTGIYSSDWDYLLERLRIKLPFLVLPFAFLSMPKLKKKECYAIFYFLLIIMSAVCVHVGMNYLADYDRINDIIGRGQPMPTPSNHIRFSLTLAMTIIGGLALMRDKFYFSSPSEKWLIRVLTLFLFVFIHVLSVRSGILALYLGLFVVGIHHAFATRRYWLAFAVAGALVALPFMAYHTIPSFQEKINYARWDFLQYQQDQGGQYSDSERITSLKVGWEIAQENLIFGIGAGDLKSAVKELYATKYAGQYSYRMPHNQFLSILGGTGVLGLLLFLSAFLYPLFYKKNYSNALFLALHAIIFMSFMMENTIENNFGISLYLFFLLIGVNYLNKSAK